MSARALAAAVLLACALPAAAAGRGPRLDPRLGRLERDFIEGWQARRPHLATRLGLHAYDARLRPVSQSSVRSDLEWLAGLEARLAAVPRAGLAPFSADERDLLAARLAAERATLELASRWERDPAAYLGLVEGGVLAALRRGAGSTCDRVREVTGRLRAVPDVLREAKVNLARAPRLLVEAAAPRFERALALYRGPVPALGLACREPRAQADLAEADSAAARAVEGFTAFLRADLALRDGAPVPLGPEATRRILADVEGVDAPVDSLVDRGLRELQANGLERESTEPGPPRGPAAPDTAGACAGPADACFERALEDARAFLESHPVVSLPSREALRVRDVAAVPGEPAAAAHLDAPGPFEPRTAPSWLDVPHPDAPADTAVPGRGPVAVRAMREGLPGRWLQALARRQAASPLREAAACAATLEGWALYAPGMMLEEGYGFGDGRRLRNAVLEDLDVELARCVATLSIHARGWSLERAEAFFADRLGMAPDEAAREALRCAAGLEPALPALGRWQILDLRARQRSRLGGRFDLRAFHDAVLAQGAVPLSFLGKTLPR